MASLQERGGRGDGRQGCLHQVRSALVQQAVPSSAFYQRHPGGRPPMFTRDHGCWNCELPFSLYLRSSCWVRFLHCLMLPKMVKPNVKTNNLKTIEENSFKCEFNFYRLFATFIFYLLDYNRNVQSSHEVNTSVTVCSEPLPVAGGLLCCCVGDMVMSRSRI